MKWGRQYARKSDAFSATEEWVQEAFWVIRQLPLDGTVVDVACNTGRLIGHALERLPGVTFIGMDINDHGLELARERHPGVQWTNTLDDIEKGSVHTVVIMHALLQMEDPVAVLCDVWDVLRPGGRLIMVHHNRWNGLLWAIPNLFNGYVRDDTITAEYSPQETAALAKDCGFLTVLLETYNGGPLLHPFPWLRPKLRYIGVKP